MAQNLMHTVMQEVVVLKSMWWILNIDLNITAYAAHPVLKSKLGVGGQL